MAVVLVFAMTLMPESTNRAPRGGPLQQLRLAVARPWARFLILFAIPEGAMVLGFIVYFAPALESTGTNPALAGLVVAPYGLAVLIGTQVVKRIASHVPPWIPISIGGTMAVAGYVAAAIDQHVVAILLASVLIGGCYSFMHSTLQAWATDIAPEVRGTAAALFVTGAFTGGALGTGAGSLLVQESLYRELFLAAALLSIPVAIVAAITRTRYPGAGMPSEASAAVSS
ncbi:MAG TPA: MFS transporter, partial [Candidatus Sulfotelmatobacter sp.]|nr:MFS transporter [Candidatus Sulfotelmatobacter sp.]